MFPKNFPKALSQEANSQGYFPKWQVPPCAIYQAAIFQVCSSRSALSPPPPPSLLRLAQTLGSGRLSNSTFGNFPLGKIPNTDLAPPSPRLRLPFYTLGLLFYNIKFTLIQIDCLA